MNFLSLPQKKLFEKSWPAFLIVSAWLWLFWPMITGQAVCGFRDSGYLYYPLFKWIDGEWASGELPLWNQYDQFGVPVVGDGSSSLFYPGKLIFWLRFLSYESRYGIYLAMHVLLAAATCYWFARRLGCTQGGATFAAVSYAFGGSVLFQVCNVIFLVGAAWLPAALGCVWLMYKKRSVTWAIAGGVICALIVLGGDPQMVYNIGLVGLGTIVGEFLGARRRMYRRNNFRLSILIGPAIQQVARLTVLAVVTGALSAIQILPTSEWAARSERARFDYPRSFYEYWIASRMTYRNRGADDSLAGLIKPPSPDTHLDHAFQFSQPPWTIAELLVPNLSGKPFPINGRWSNAFPGADRMWVPSLYSGCLAAIFGLLAFRLWGKRRRQVWLSRVGLFFALGSFGWYGLGWLAGEFVDLSLLPFDVGPQVGGVYWLIVIAFPKYVMFRYPAKLFVIAALAMCTLAGMGLSRFRCYGSKTWLNALKVVPIICLGCMIVMFALSLAGVLNRLWALVPVDPLFGPFDAAGAHWALQFAFAQVLLVSLITVAIFRRIVRSNRSRGWAILVLVATLDVITANQWMLANVPRSVFTKEVNRVFTEPPLNVLPYPQDWQKESSRSRLEEIVDWQRQTLFPKHHLEVPLRHDESFSSIEGSRVTSSATSNMNAYWQLRDYPKRVFPMVEHRNSYYRFEIELPNEKRIVPFYCFVLIPIRNTSGWEIKVTKQEGEIFYPPPLNSKRWGVPWGYTVVDVPTGRSTIEMRYRPQAFCRGAWISGFSWGLLVLLIVVQQVFEKRGKRRIAQ